jgi:small-conductance mechanosensitive channel
LAQQVGAQAGELAGRLALAAVLVLVLWALTWLARRAARRALRRTPALASAGVLIDRTLQIGFLFLAVTWVFAIFGVQLTGLVAILGAASLAVSLSLQDVLKNLVAGVIILVERPFGAGDLIDFRTFSGVVERIDLRTTILRARAGQRVVIPNAMLFSEALVNRSAYGRQLVRLRVVVPPGDGERQAEQVLDALRSATGEAISPPGAPDGQGPEPAPAVLVETLSAEKAILRAEVWAADASTATPRLAWALRRRLPEADISVLE